MAYPEQRMRRMRRTEAIRTMVRETTLTPGNLIQPLFVTNEPVSGPIGAMPGMKRLCLEELLETAHAIRELGIPGVLLFGIPDAKDASGRSAWDPQEGVQQAIRTLRQEVPELVIMSDVCLCQYTDHGHCGVLRDGEIDNEATLDHLARVALSHGQAGADLVAPSDMMDGRVGRIRQALDGHQLSDVGIMSYAVKYASAFYGPFREAAGSTPRQGDRQSYQMDPANVREAIREAQLDVQEGADILLVKPALSYLDVIRAVRQATDVPLAAYNVSGEYAMVKAAAQSGWLDEKRTVLEILLSIRRAGSDLIMSYHAMDAARWLREDAGW